VKRSQYTEEQIVRAIDEHEQGKKAEEICRKLGVSQATFYAWKKQYAGLGIAELREVRQLREENARLKRLVADLTLDRQILQEAMTKKF
jgi:putative transposase